MGQLLLWYAYRAWKKAGVPTSIIGLWASLWIGSGVAALWLAALAWGPFWQHPDVSQVERGLIIVMGLALGPMWLAGILLIFFFWGLFAFVGSFV